MQAVETSGHPRVQAFTLPMTYPPTVRGQGPRQTLQVWLRMHNMGVAFLAEEHEAPGLLVAPPTRPALPPMRDRLRVVEEACDGVLQIERPAQREPELVP